MQLVAPSKTILTEKAQPVLDFDDPKLKLLISGMLEMAADTQGSGKRTMVGLAAPQVGFSSRVIVVNIAATGKRSQELDFKVFINPKVISKSKKYKRNREGCFSTGRVCGAVSRPDWVEIEYFDSSGHKYTRTFKDFPARVVQHEIDHLNGKRFPDRIRGEQYLHWVELDEFDDYRDNWRSWDKLCSREKWKSIKTG